MTKSTLTTDDIKEIISGAKTSLEQLLALELLAASEAQGVLAGKFVLEPLEQRYHHIKRGEYQHTEPKLPMINLFTAPPAPAVPDEFLSAKQNSKGMFELSEDCMCKLAAALKLSGNSEQVKE
ncbi:hypothetical protein [Serratia sp. UGAL515B_01]|uniref:hypothetical protein n=1 Tax=Serratia sp. UGAL515B_01 TaxID=2986763 RepID=UPI002952D35F|nr:hypothetical protein [Serratia sp. UGAL515B_01]WON77534.1 hypothetical protein OK023_02175 [Serratia sp. UGAL515B_01]